jgi:hypothetical protein
VHSKDTCNRFTTGTILTCRSVSCSSSANSKKPAPIKCQQAGKRPQSVSTRSGPLHQDSEDTCLRSPCLRFVKQSAFPGGSLCITPSFPSIQHSQACRFSDHTSRSAHSLCSSQRCLPSDGDVSTGTLKGSILDQNGETLAAQRSPSLTSLEESLERLPRIGDGVYRSRFSNREIPAPGRSPGLCQGPHQGIELTVGQIVRLRVKLNVEL